MAWDGPKSRLAEQNFRDDEEMRPRLTREGVKLDLSCPHCSAFSEVTLEWAEIVALAQGACPAGFTPTPTGHEYSLICPRCVTHYKGRPGMEIQEQPGMDAEEVAATRRRRREISMVRPIGLEAVAKWLHAAKAYGLVR